MKIALCSDLHLEMVSSPPIMTADADVLILSGDICVADHFTKSEESPYHSIKMLYLDFFKRCADKYANVIYVMGNHEHYHGRFDRTYDMLDEAIGHYATLLDRESVIIDSVKFIGGTLWTNAHSNNPITVETIQTYMNDYRVVQTFDGKYYRKLRAFDTIKHFEKMIEFIDQEATPDQKCVVVTHHAPTELSIAEKYKDQFHLNGGYYSDLYDFIADRPQIKLWTHGHVHSPFEYNVGETTVACNPKGYPGEGVTWNSNYVIEI